MRLPLGGCAAVLAGVTVAACAARGGGPAPAPMRAPPPAAAAPGASAAAPAPPARTRPVRGIVVDGATGRPLAGLIVAATGERAQTDAHGSFTLAAQPDVYDLVVADRDHRSVSIYRRLGQRQPRLVHGPAARYSIHDLREPTPRAQVRGALAVEAGGPADGAAGHVAFLAEAAGAEVAIDGGMKRFGPLGVDWTGMGPISGDLLALLAREDGAARARGASADEAGESAAHVRGWAARRPLTVEPDSVVVADLALAPLATRAVAGTLAPPPGWRAITLQETYRFAGGGELPLRRLDRAGLRAFRDEVPDPGALGGVLCVTASADDDGTATTTACGPALDGPRALALQPPPRLAEPAPHARFEAGTRFAWSRFAGGVHVLRLEVTVPKAAAPNVTLYTAETSATWPSVDLAAIDVSFPAACTVYTVTAGGLGPYASIDEAVGAGGLGARAPLEARVGWSPPREVQVPRWPTPAPGSEEARFCHYPRGQGIMCGPQEFYVLSAINNKLRHFPAFAAAIGIYCVPDCATARAFWSAYRTYRTDHPGFDAHEPLDMEDC
jgi:hypothetical protein